MERSVETLVAENFNIQMFFTLVIFLLLLKRMSLVDLYKIKSLSDTNFFH